MVFFFVISKRMFFVSIKTEKNKNVRHCGTVTVRRSVQPALQISGQTAKYMREFWYNRYRSVINQTDEIRKKGNKETTPILQ